MTALQNFDFEDQLVRMVLRDNEPWFVGKDVCNAIGLAKHHQALRNLDNNERDMFPIHTSSGSQEMVIISEPGLYRLVFRSRKPAAERFNSWLTHEVLPSIRKTGRYNSAPEAPARESQNAKERRQALELVREARLLYGSARARELWDLLPELPTIPPAPEPPPSARSVNGQACLTHLLDFETSEGQTLRDLIQATSNGDIPAGRVLRDYGVRVVHDPEDGEGIAVASSHKGILTVFRKSKWASKNHKPALRLIEGAKPYKTLKYGYQHSSMSTFIGMDWLTEL